MRVRRPTVSGVGPSLSLAAGDAMQLEGERCGWHLSGGGYLASLIGLRFVNCFGSLGERNDKPSPASSKLKRAGRAGRQPWQRPGLRCPEEQARGPVS